MNRKTSRLTSSLSVILAVAILLCGAHAKDVTGLQIAAKTPAKKFLGGDDTGLVKVSPDLHNHIDKHQFKSLVQPFDNSNLQADSRSLKSHEDIKKEIERKQSEMGWLSGWLQLARMSIGIF